jgi:hypothetical protein
MVEQRHLDQAVAAGPDADHGHVHTRGDAVRLGVEVVHELPGQHLHLQRHRWTRIHRLHLRR